MLIQKEKLIIFDIDGTLLNSTDIDSECYIQSLDNEFGIKEVNNDWSMYKEATDSGIFEEIYKKYYNTSPIPYDYIKHENRFFNILKTRSENDSHLLIEISVTKKIISLLKSLPYYFIAIATGSYKKTALLKLEQINISENDFPFTTANDGKKRKDILKICIEKAKKLYKIDRFDKIISIGDEIWDLKTAMNLSIPFLGIGKNKFKKISNCLSLDNYSIPEEIFLNILDKTFVPELFYDKTLDINN